MYYVEGIYIYMSDIDVDALISNEIISIYYYDNF